MEVWGLSRSVDKLIRLIFTLNTSDAADAEIAFTIVDDNGFRRFGRGTRFHEIAFLMPDV